MDVDPAPLVPDSLHEPVLRWYAEHARDLPWRGPGATPWAVMVSEFMLQQTPVARVLPVFEQWMERWPSPADLAREPSGEAVRAWGRLGYPRRALRLHAAAVAIVERHVTATSPIKVEYELTERGRELAPALGELKRWADRWLN